MERRRTAGDGERVSGAAICGELHLELRHSRSGAPPTGSHRFGHRGKKLLVDPQICQRDLPARYLGVGHLWSLIREVGRNLYEPGWRMTLTNTAKKDEMKVQRS